MRLRLITRSLEGWGYSDKAPSGSLVWGNATSLNGGNLRTRVAPETDTPQLDSPPAWAEEERILIKKGMTRFNKVLDNSWNL
ncbi:MAG: hypothetical protein AAFS12_17960 [Cyanobacteria bacterium J06632_19]